MVSSDLLSITKDMIRAAETGRWEDVTTLENQRRIMLIKFESEINNERNKLPIEYVNENVREILSLNNRMIELCDGIKAELSNAIGGLLKGRKAINAYYDTK